ncbi:AraC family transcriptional regulator [Cohnella sp. JJ-181]|uniref:AraC family transcriptional regulator n=1 Tax=Cohnella rhizoplanae TaxID=2974897 RepID=UPI0022FF6BAA|nr:AraC family transcriptional regulator [Cohnella sp. JJ-181]CAI6080393.1 Arabinose operon regulatory protein [Cohnella sp. JJ-181]
MNKTPTYRVASNPARTLPQSLAVLFAGESQTRPAHRVGPKVVDYYLLHHVISGRGVFESDGLAQPLGPGHTFLIRPKRLFSYASDAGEPWRYRWVAFSGDRVDALLAEAGLGADRLVVDTGAARAPGDRCRDIYDAFRARAPSASLEAAGQLHLLLAALTAAGADRAEQPPKPDTHGEELVRQVIGYLSTQYAEPLTIEAMAETLGYNRAYLSRLFKRHAGVTPIAFLTRIRIDRAKRLLRERPELTVEQVASSVGFQDSLYFSKQFRRAFGATPTGYRADALRS